MISAAIVGGSGYTGGELARLLCRHPEIEVQAMTSRQHAGVKISKAHPFLNGFVDLNFTDKLQGNDFDVVFTATPHGASMDVVPELVASGVKCIDLSGDYRLVDPDLYKKWYGLEHRDVENLSKAVYGIPELFRDQIKSADLVANPGCYPTCSTLALAPLFAKGLVEERVIIDAKSGTSGAGAEPTKATHHPTCGASLTPYKVGVHRHMPEIKMILERVSGSPVELIFTPHLVPVVRGAGGALVRPAAADLAEGRRADLPAGSGRAATGAERPRNAHRRAGRRAAPAARRTRWNNQDLRRIT